MTNTSALLSSDSNEHYTPSYIVEAARVSLGSIDLDPFSCALANTVVRAATYISPEQTGQMSRSTDGFAVHWTGNIFCNPPGGKVGRDSQQALAWRKLMAEHSVGRCRSAIFVCFNLGFLQVAQSHPGTQPLSFPICYPSSRVAYLVNHLPRPTASQPNRKPSKKQIADFEATGLCEGDSPPGASCVVFVPDDGSAIVRDLAIERFVKAFSPIGQVVVPQAIGSLGVAA